MKKTIFIVKISLVLNAYYLPKYKSIKPANKSGLAYLNTSEFDFNKTIYIEINSHNSYIDKWIYYDFSDEKNFLSPSKFKKPTSSWSSSTYKDDNQITSFTNKYCYEIVKNTPK